MNAHIYLEEVLICEKIKFNFYSHFAVNLLRQGSMESEITSFMGLPNHFFYLDSTTLFFLINSVITP
ncbi:hypothetical protein pah_c209o003 [Parachlamydia acanthamoebae str. Hall's coccus]|nr:hypothetical protein pah_c209o003 [Parachlamydia acanthamoebae str. Hall's coccus]